MMQICLRGLNGNGDKLPMHAVTPRDVPTSPMEARPGVTPLRLGLRIRQLPWRSSRRHFVYYETGALEIRIAATIRTLDAPCHSDAANLQTTLQTPL